MATRPYGDWLLDLPHAVPIGKLGWDADLQISDWSFPGPSIFTSLVTSRRSTVPPLLGESPGVGSYVVGRLRGGCPLGVWGKTYHNEPVTTCHLQCDRCFLHSCSNKPFSFD